MRSINSSVSLLVFWVFLLSSCGQSGSRVVEPPATPLVQQTNSMVEVESSVTELPSVIGGEMGDDGSPKEIRFLFDKGSEASYSIREELLGVGFPNDAIGLTRKINGRLVLSSEGAILPYRSLVTIDLASIKSDESRRDNYVRRNTLQTSIYPLAKFYPQSTIGLPSPLPTEGEYSFKIIGETFIRGLARTTVWNVTATFSEKRIVGSANTQFSFEEFEITIPKVRRVLSVEDLIKLKILFQLTRID